MLTEDVRSFLVDSGIVTSTQLSDAEEAARSGQLHVELAGSLILNIASAFVPQSLASYLNIPLQQVDAWLASGLLSAFFVGNLVLIPAWQIDSSTHTGLLNSLQGLHDLEDAKRIHDLGDFMYDAQPTLRRHAAATPVGWLSSGGDMQPVLNALNDLQRTIADRSGV
ncbi:hypothetical protein [Frondihabitans sucicola]|nr:hypothetical protein [Frondihabitans sucicola]